jgi:uncharacterized protein YjiS (DUF1127 family)
METVMSTKIPVLPLAAATLARGFAGLTAVVTHWSLRFARALRHRHEARVLASLDQHMLADIGITRADVNDAFSRPFWEDPTELLIERSGERRHNRPRSAPHVKVVTENAFRQPPTNRAPNYLI